MSEGQSRSPLFLWGNWKEFPGGVSRWEGLVMMGKVLVGGDDFVDDAASADKIQRN